MDSQAAEARPTVFHVTHWKAGSTWLARILGRCDRSRIVAPLARVAHFLEEPIEPGKVYPRVYVTREEFDDVDPPLPWRRFVVIRDLRDTLVSGYFSVKLSHPENPNVVRERARLQALSQEEGLVSMLDQPMVVKSAEIQASWVDAGVPLIRYESLLERDVEILRRVLIEECEFPLRPRALGRIVERSRFEALSGGRSRGDEDITSHFRKGLAGDWRNYFSGAMKAAFKERWGELLVATGYERDDDW